jgi:Spy/CpxP family protein refolding chaperone
MKKMTLFSLALALLLAFGVAVSAQPGSSDHPMGQRMHSFNGQGGFGDGHGGRGMRGDRMGHLLAMADELELTPDQIDKIKALQTSFQLQMVDMRAELQKARIEMRSLKQADNASETTVFAAIDQMSKKQAEIKKAAYSHREKVQAVLTDEQTAKLKEMQLKQGRQGCGSRFDNDDEDDDTPRPRGGHQRGWDN